MHLVTLSADKNGALADLEIANIVAPLRWALPGYAGGNQTSIGASALEGFQQSAHTLCMTTTTAGFTSVFTGQVYAIAMLLIGATFCQIKGKGLAKSG